MPLSIFYRDDCIYPTGKINPHYSYKAELCIVIILADATNGARSLRKSFVFRRLRFPFFR
jgi:hypothetical protein